MRAGFASIDITPDLGAHIPGGFAPRPSTGVHDPLRVRACSLESIDGRLAVVGVDAVSLAADTVEEARSRIHIRGLAPRDVLIAASHTHCGGPSNDVLGTDSDPAYKARLAEAIAEAVRQAAAAAVPVTVSSVTTACHGWAFNRRWVMPDGTQVTNPGKGNPDIVKPAGPVDPEVTALVFRSENDQWLGAITNFACHCTVMPGSAFSGDYPAAWEKALAQHASNPAFQMVFLNGACGDINQLDFSRNDVKETGPEWTTAMGQALADAAWQAIESATPFRDMRLAAAHGDVHVPFRVPTPKALERARDILQGAADADSKDSQYWLARDLLLLNERIGKRTSRSVPVDLYRIGSTILAAAPWQPFCQYGLRLKTAMPLPCMPVAFANGMVGYVPTPEGLAAGGYEPRLCRGSCLAPQSGGAIVGRMLSMLPQVLADMGVKEL